MPPRFGWRIVAALLPLGTGILGLLNGLGDWDHATTLLQQVAGLGVLLYGPLGVGAAVALVADLRWRTLLLRTWAVALVVTGAVSSAAWGTPPAEMNLRAGMSMALMGVVAGLSTALFCVLVFWLARMAYAPTTPTPQ